MRKENTMDQIIKERYDLLGPRVAEAMERRQFQAWYVSSAAEATEKLLELIGTEDTVGWGGSMTLNALGIKDALRQRGQKLLDRDAVSAPEEKTAVMRAALTADVFLMSANAITQSGELFNIDGNGNRVAALCFGPKSVIVVAGMNKVVADMDAAYARARHVAAPTNGVRFHGSTPCAQTGACADCLSPGCICAQLVETRFSRPAQKIKVILIGEELGY